MPGRAGKDARKLKSRLNLDSAMRAPCPRLGPLRHNRHALNRYAEVLAPVGLSQRPTCALVIRPRVDPRSILKRAEKTERGRTLSDGEIAAPSVQASAAILIHASRLFIEPQI